MNDTLVQSVKKATAILDILIFQDTEKKGIGLIELGKILDIRPNTLHNLLKTLISCDYVEQREDSKYAAGLKVFQIGKLNNRKEIVNKIEPVLQITCDKIEESVVCTTLFNGKRITILNIDCENTIKIDMLSIEEEHIYKKSTGRVLTAFADDYSFSLIKNNWGYPGGKWDGIEDDSSFEKVRESIRKTGYTVCLSSKNTIISFSVPVFDSKGIFFGAIGSYAPVFRCDEDKQKKILEELQVAAKIIEKEISHL